MALVYADIKLIKTIDTENARRNIIDDEEMRVVALNILVDSGA